MAGKYSRIEKFCENSVILKQGQELLPSDLEVKYLQKASEALMQSGVHSGDFGPSDSLSLDINEKQILRNALIKWWQPN